MKHKKYLLLLIIPVLVLLINRSFSLSYTHEIRSVEIQSSDYNQPGSWYIDKSAEWTGFGKARVTFDVNSVVKKGNEHYKDVVLVIDRSGSMEGDKLAKAKEDAADLTNYLLSDSHNRVALITFDTSSSVKSGFTNNKNQILGYINNITEDGSTNYNAGLLNVDVVMENYVRDTNKDLIVLFLTDGYPNLETRNEKATYQMLKDKYPYMTINGIQYEMGGRVIQDIIDISDFQYIANMDTLNNVLFEAAVAPVIYDNFVIEDYIYGDYFYVDSVNDIEVPFGTVTVENVNNTQKVTWNLGNNYVTGHNVKMYINLKLKNTYQNTRGLYPTNQSETIKSKLPDESIKTKTSEDTPVLLNAYNVIYETNAPEGCNLPAIQNEVHYVYQTVTKRNDSLTCPGYNFKGWYIKGSDILDINMINDSTFIMPPRDVTIRGTWTKQDLVKTMDGTVFEKLDGTLMYQYSSTGGVYGGPITRNSVESIITVSDIEVPDDAIDFWDASNEQNGSILAWYKDQDNDGKNELYIGQEGGVKANPNSRYAFSNYDNLEFIDLTNLKTSNVTSMMGMFYHTAYNSSSFEIRGLSGFDTSKVTSMSYMFYLNAVDATTWNIGDLSNWDTSKVTDMSRLFLRAGADASTWNVGDLSNWDVSNVTNMSEMFYAAANSDTTVNLDLSTWNTSKVTNMSKMFGFYGENAVVFSLGDLSNWDTSNVTDMSEMFYRTGYNSSSVSLVGIDRWNTSKVTNMSNMFRFAFYMSTSLNIGNIGNWDVSKVKNMENMFYQMGVKSQSFNLDLSNWDTSSVTNMSYMFYYAGRDSTSFNIGNLSSWDTSKVTNMSNMFSASGESATSWNIGDLSNWNVSNVENMQAMFDSAGESATSWNIGDLSNWDTSNVTKMASMFNQAGNKATTWFAGDLSNWNVSNVPNMSYMFQGAGGSATTFTIGNLSNWDVSNVTNMSSMFSSSGYNATTWSVGDLSNWDMSKVTTTDRMFERAGYNATTWNIGDLSNWDVSNVKNMFAMFYYAGYSATTWTIGNLSNWNTSSAEYMGSMFSDSGYSATTWTVGDLSGWDTSKVTDMSDMFYQAGYSATTWSVGDLSNWDTSKVTNMAGMFYGAGSSATTWNTIGTLKVYADNINSIFEKSSKANAILNIYNKPTSYKKAFENASTVSGSGITVNYSSATTNIDSIIATKSTNSNVVKGVQLD